MLSSLTVGLPSRKGPNSKTFLLEFVEDASVATAIPKTVDVRNYIGHNHLGKSLRREGYAESMLSETHRSPPIASTCGRYTLGRQADKVTRDDSRSTPHQNLLGTAMHGSVRQPDDGSRPRTLKRFSSVQPT